MACRLAATTKALANRVARWLGMLLQAYSTTCTPIGSDLCVDGPKLKRARQGTRRAGIHA